ncbi:MAG: DUF1349 domain-containing protein [Atribacterota bacterium]|nr:DUF1349 domain-containing protein [Atribacterota bacterium]
MKINIKKTKWLNCPTKNKIMDDYIEITTDPETDFWQRTYYGFRRNNGHALLFEEDKNFTFTARVDFKYKNRFDQCGLIVFVNEDNWCKTSLEHENKYFSRLGSVVTVNGYSDWATADSPNFQCIWYRINRRDSDFLVEYSLDKIEFKQMRIFHLPIKQNELINFGFYACSPNQSSFTAIFSDFKLDGCIWLPHN